MKNSLLFLVFLLFTQAIHAQVKTFEVTFESDSVDELPQTIPGGGDKPTGLFGNFGSAISVQNVSGDVANSGAAGKVLTTRVASGGDFQLIDFEGFLNSGILVEDTVILRFDFMVEAGLEQEGFAFLRCYDESGESFADMGFNFEGDNFNIGLLDYDPATGDYLGWRDPPAPDNRFDAGRWYHLDVLIDLDNNTLQLLIDGKNYGVQAGISRVTGDGYAGAFFNWGSAYEGASSIDNFSVEIVGQASLPPPPDGFEELLTVADQGGELIRMPCGDFRKRGIDWRGTNSARLVYDSIYQGVSVYKLAINNDMDEADARLWSFKQFPIKANRTYEVSALIRTDFPRATWEMNLGLNGATATGDIGLGARYAGMPAKTSGPDGWQRWTWQFTPHWDDRYEYVSLFLGAHEYGPGFDDNFTFEIADLAFVELPARPLEPFSPGEGVSFAGGAGNLPMQVEGVQDLDDTLSVLVTGAEYKFLRNENAILLEQRIDFERQLMELTNVPLSGLTVQRQSSSEVVLVGNALTIGIQMDGVMVISPQEDIQPGIESTIGGDFNRMEAGDLLSQDDFGGFTINLHTPKGTGLSPQLELLTNGLDFPSFDGDDLSSLGAAEPGWQAEARVRPGERLFVSAFPCRPYDWAKSFDHHWGLSDYNFPLEYDDPDYMSDWVLWNINQRGWAMSFGPRYEIREDVPFQDHFDAIAAEGDRWSAYFSQWFYYSRDAEEWTDEIKRWRDAYGMGAIYSDGLAQDDWLSAYEAMRRLRGDVFPDGNIIIHDSYPQSGVAAASFRPFIYTYATGTYMGENAVASAGADWAWARYVMGQYRKANAFGVTKGDAWAGANGVDKYLIALVWGGRGRPDVSGYDSEYMPILNQLKTLWETHGNDPYFFDRYYHPEAQLLTGFEIGRAGMPIFGLDTTASNDIRIAISSWTPEVSIHYTTDGSAPTEDSPVYDSPIEWDGQSVIRAMAVRSDLDDSRVATWFSSPTTSIHELGHSFHQPFVESIFPNPSHSTANIRYHLPAGGDVQLELTNATGTIHRQVDIPNALAGYHVHPLAVGDIPAGAYWVRMKVGDYYSPPLKLMVLKGRK
ncbi:MAG: chitobiase/beta-hexosaminidase C-terminal domain-containing protein [Bacteroidota bacterium]